MKLKPELDWSGTNDDGFLSKSKMQRENYRTYNNNLKLAIYLLEIAAENYHFKRKERILMLAEVDQLKIIQLKQPSL